MILFNKTKGKINDDLKVVIKFITYTKILRCLNLFNCSI